MRDLKKIARQVDAEVRQREAAQVNLARKLFPSEVIAQIERKAAKDAAARDYKQIQAELLWTVYDRAYRKALDGRDATRGVSRDRLLQAINGGGTFELTDFSPEEIEATLRLALSALSETAPSRYGFEKAHAVCILLCRDALLHKDYEGAYHWLYTLDSKQVPHDPFKPWAELEALAGADYKPEEHAAPSAMGRNEIIEEIAGETKLCEKCVKWRLTDEQIRGLKK